MKGDNKEEINKLIGFDLLRARWKAQDDKWPNRHKEIHKGCCKRCPSYHDAKRGFTDPETAEFKTWPKEALVKEALFVCAWRPNKLCKGLCDNLGIDQYFLDKVYMEATEQSTVKFK